MTSNPKNSEPDAETASQKLAEMEAVYASARKMVGDLIRSIESGGEGLKDLTSSLATLHKIFVAVTEAEEKFNDRFGSIERPGDIDFDAIKDEVGRRLDRLRDAAGPEGFS